MVNLFKADLSRPKAGQIASALIKYRIVGLLLVFLRLCCLIGLNLQRAPFTDVLVRCRCCAVQASVTFTTFTA